jgi:hypothetical protein
MGFGKIGYEDMNWTVLLQDWDLQWLSSSMWNYNILKFTTEF